ncbi:MAG: hypothetical protein HKO95_09915 [Rhodobacteraceae bacterium]|nr:sulfotransferase domain-containing protein [Alphaproteobacteria bacterium]NNK67042.1 hypothetical protein [Paracoccaceae bacterium]
MRVIGIYSFPKSGNTWLRTILGEAMGKRKRKIPDLHKQAFAASHEFKGMRFFKSHSGSNLVVSGRGEHLGTTNVIHIRRNPLDVFVSYLNYISDNVQRAAPIGFESVETIHGTQLFDLYFHTFVTAGHLSLGFAHETGSYFEHNRFWLEQDEVPVVHLRYEDMLHAPLEALEEVRGLIGLDEAEMARAVHGAADLTQQDGKFFWKQEEGNYLNYLSQEQIELFLAYRGKDCLALGYPPDYLRNPKGYPHHTPHRPNSAKMRL